MECGRQGWDGPRRGDLTGCVGCSQCWGVGTETQEAGQGHHGRSPKLSVHQCVGGPGWAPPTSCSHRGTPLVQIPGILTGAGAAKQRGRGGGGGVCGNTLPAAGLRPLPPRTRSLHRQRVGGRQAADGAALLTRFPRDVTVSGPVSGPRPSGGRAWAAGGEAGLPEMGGASHKEQTRPPHSYGLSYRRGLPGDPGLGVFSSPPAPL